MSHPVYQVPAGDVLPIFFSTYSGSTGASITLTGLAVTDIEIYKDASMTQRASDAGYALIDTDGIDVDSLTGIHGFTIDTGDNTDAGFYTVGAWFTVVVSAVTVDGQTVNFIAAQFRLMPGESVAGKPKVDTDTFGGVAATASGGRPEVNTSHAAGTAWNSGAIGPNTLASDTLTAAKVAADVTTELQSGLATAASLATVAGYIDTEVASIKSVTDKLDTSMELDGAVYRFTTNALEQGPGGGAIPTASQIADEVQTRTIAGVTEVTRLASQERSDIADAYLDRSNGVEAGLTPRQAMRLGAMADAGNMIPLGNTVTGKNFGNTKTRIQAETDEQGTRTITFTDLT